MLNKKRISFKHTPALNRFVSVWAMVSFLLSTVCSSAPLSAAAVPTNATFDLVIPPTAVHIDELYNPKNAPHPDVILVLDAHANLDAQRNISLFLRSVTENIQAPRILVEGAVGYVDTSLLSLYPNIKTRNAVTENLFRKMHINGTELFSALYPERNPEILGIEKAELYIKNLQAFQRVLGQRSREESEIKKVGEALHALESTLYSSSFKRFLALKKRALVRGAWKDYLLYLVDEQKIETIDIKKYPMLSEIKSGLKIDDTSIRFEQLTAEMETLEREICKRSLTTYEAAALYSLSERFELLTKAFRLNLIPSEADYLSRNVRAFSAGEFIKFLTRMQPEAAPRDGWTENLLQSVLDFYKFAKLRDRALSENILQKRRNDGAPTFVITGGFHRTGITEELRRHHLAYAVVTPLIKSGTNEAHYQNLMNATVSGNTLAMASRFDLAAVDPLRSDSSLASIITGLVTQDAITTRQNRESLLAAFQNAHRVRINRRSIAPAERKQVLARADRLFERARTLLTHRSVKSTTPAGFGKSMFDTQSGAFEIEKIQQVIRSGGNNIVFFGGSTNIRKTFEIPLAHFLAGEKTGIFAQSPPPTVVDAKKIKESLETLVNGHRANRLTRLGNLVAYILGLQGKKFVIIQNFHLVGDNEYLKPLVDRLLHDPSTFVIGMSPAEEFHRVESVWGGKTPLNYSWRGFHPNSKTAETLRKRKVLVIGASGFAGQATYQYLKNTRNEVVGTYFTGSQVSHELKNEMRYLDVTDQEALNKILEEEKPDDIFYFSGDVNLDAAQKNSKLAYALNADAVFHFKPYMNSHPNARFVYISTDAVFEGNLKEGEAGYLTSSEAHPPHEGDEIQHYGNSKIEGERNVRDLFPNQHLIVRLPFLIGVNKDNPNRKIAHAEKIIKILDARVINGQEQISLDSSRTRWPLLIDYVPSAIERFLLNNAQGTYQLAGPRALTEYDLAVETATRYARRFPFLTFEIEKPADYLRSTFMPAHIPKPAPRGKRAWMIPSNIAPPLESILQQLITDISFAGQGSGRSIVVSLDNGTILKRSTRDRRGMQKLRDEIAWYRAAEKIPEIKGHIPKILKVTDTPTRVELVLERTQGPTIIDLILQGKVKHRRLGQILRRVYAFIAHEIHGRKIAYTEPTDIVLKQHVDRMSDRLREYTDRLKEVSSRKNYELAMRMIQQEQIEINGVRYPNLFKQIAYLKNRLRQDTLFFKVLTPPADAVVLVHGDTHIGNISYDIPTGYFGLFDPKGYLATDYLYDVAKVIHDFVGKFPLINYDLFDAETDRPNSEVKIDYRLDRRHIGFKTLEAFRQRNLQQTLLSTLLSEEKRKKDPYWFIRLAFTHLAHWTGIPPFQIRGDSIDTSAVVYAYAVQLFQEFFELYDSWTSGQLKTFMDKHEGQYLGFTYEKLKEIGFPVDGPIQESGFGASEISNAASNLRITLGGELPLSQTQMAEAFQSDLDRLREKLAQPTEVTSLIITDQSHLPGSFNILENHIAKRGRLAFTFAGTLEEGKRFFEQRYKTPFPEGFVDIIPYRDERNVAQLVNNFIQSNASKGIETPHIVNYFGAEHPKMLGKVLRNTYKVYALNGSIGLLEWDVLRLLVQVGENNPAVKPFLIPFNERGVFKIASMEEYLYKAMRADKSVSMAA